MSSRCTGRAATSPATPAGRRPPAADGLLHRHLGVHRLQGLRGGLQGVERASPRTASTLHRDVLRQHRRARRRHLAARGVHRAAKPLGHRGPRHAGASRPAADARPPTAPADGDTGVPLADVVRRLQALHARRLPRRLPDRRAVPHRVRHGRRAGGHLQRLRLLRAGLPVRRDRPAQGRRPGLGSARCATTGSSDGLEPACAKACPTESIQFGELDELRERADARLAAAARARASTDARLYGARPGRRRRRRRRVLPAARRAGGLRPAAGPGRDHPGPAGDVAARAALAAATLLAGGVAVVRRAAATR